MAKSKEWTKATALNYLRKDGVGIVKDYPIFPRQGFRGLTACSAYDFLTLK